MRARRSLKAASASFTRPYVEPGDRVISIMPTYQQLYSIPESFGADLKLLHLSEKNGFLPDLDELRALAVPGTKMICINNPNNPTGALMSKDMLMQIVEIAKSVGAYVMCDEVYRHLTQDDVWSESIVDLYDKGISVSSMSKVFSLAGIRLGWIATHDKSVIKSCLSHRDYNRMKGQRHIVPVCFFIFVCIFFDNSLVFAMGGDEQIGSAEYITQAGHPVYQHISCAGTHK